MATLYVVFILHTSHLRTSYQSYPSDQRDCNLREELGCQFRYDYESRRAASALPLRGERPPQHGTDGRAHSLRLEKSHHDEVPHLLSKLHFHQVMQLFSDMLTIQKWEIGDLLQCNPLNGSICLIA